MPIVDNTITKHMEKRQLKQLVREKINEGKNHNEIYEELRLTTDARNRALLNAIRFIPTLEARKKYQILYVIWIGLTGLVAFNTFVEIVSTMLLFPIAELRLTLVYGFLWQAFSVYCLITYRSRIYNWLGGIYTTCFLILLLACQINIFTIESSIILVLYAFNAFCGFYFGQKFTAQKTTETFRFYNEEGKSRIRSIYKFTD